jgi:AAA+ ATPase superfamily predicted ATPase
MMETEVLGYKSPLYGRRTGQWKIQPMPFSEASKFRQIKSFEDKMLHYSVAGGIPAYWLQFSKKKNFYQNLKDHVLKKGEMLYDEVEFLLREELREPRYYFSLLQAIAQGKRKLSEIMNATGISQPVANKYLGVLSDLDIVEREVPVTEAKPLKSKKGLYRIKDEFFQFWFGYVFPRRGEIEMDRQDNVISAIKQDIQHHLSQTYEKIALSTLQENAGLFFPFDKLGRWWDRNEELDIVGINKELNAILFSEVKWSEKPVGVNILTELKTKTEKVQWGNSKTSKHFALFSRKGFTKDMLKVAEKEKIVLFKGVEKVG